MKKVGYHSLIERIFLFPINFKINYYLLSFSFFHAEKKAQNLSEVPGGRLRK